MYRKAMRRAKANAVTASTRAISGRIGDKRYFTMFDQARREFNAARRADAKKHDTQAIESIIKSQMFIQEKLRKLTAAETSRDAKVEHMGAEMSDVRKKVDRLLAILDPDHHAAAAGPAAAADPAAAAQSPQKRRV